MQTQLPQTNLRNLRKILDRTMAEAEKALREPPAVCRHIRELRLERREHWKAEHPGEKGNPFTQENVAPRVGVTRDQYVKYEKNVEPSLERLRAIAGAFGLPGDYFDPVGPLAEMTASLEAETERVKAVADDLEVIVPALRELLEALGRDEGRDQARGEQP